MKISMYHEILNSFDAFLERFRKFEGPAAEKIPSIHGISFNTEGDQAFIIRVIGRVVRVEFDMVVGDSLEERGQITASLVRHAGTALESENHILVRWFDYQGNIYDNFNEGLAAYNIRQPDYPEKFVKQVVEAMIERGLLAPYTEDIQED